MQYRPGEYIIRWYDGEPKLFAMFDGRQWTIHGERPKPPGKHPFWAQRQPDDMFN